MARREQGSNFIFIYCLLVMNFPILIQPRQRRNLVVVAFYWPAPSSSVGDGGNNERRSSGALCLDRRSDEIVDASIEPLGMPCAREGANMVQEMMLFPADTWSRPILLSARVPSRAAAILIAMRMPLYPRAPTIRRWRVAAVTPAMVLVC
jgi:hypothetical protein